MKILCLEPNKYRLLKRRCCAVVFLNHRNNPAIIHFSCLLWSFRLFGVAELVSAFIHSTVMDGYLYSAFLLYLST